MLGGIWLERNVGTLIAHVLDLVTNPKAASSHVEAVYSRKCVNFILRGTVGKLLGEGAQAAACKEIAHIILKQMNSIGIITLSYLKEMLHHIMLCCNITSCASIAILQTSARKTLKIAIKRHYSANTCWCVRYKKWAI